VNAARTDVDAATRVKRALLEGYSRSSDPSKIPDVESGKASAKLEKTAITTTGCRSSCQFRGLGHSAGPGDSIWLQSEHPTPELRLKAGSLSLRRPECGAEGGRS
jgi:hypothetical protein